MDDSNRAREVTDFLSLLCHTGDFSGKPFSLMPWQEEVIRNVYGTLKPDGSRQYQYAYLEVPKKNGKTEIVAGLLLYHATCDPVGGQIFCCAAEREQAALVFNAALKMLDQFPQLKKLYKVRESMKELINRKTGTTVKVLSAEAYSKHGFNPTVVVFDELHAQPNRDLWDVMTFGAGAARREPLWWVITTAGNDPDRTTVGWEQHAYAKGIIDGSITDPRWFARIYCAPDDADIYDEETWYKANPSLGVTIPIETIRGEAQAAKNSESAEKLFRWLRLNQWVSTKRTSWLPLTLWDSVLGSWSPDDMRGKQCYLGLDLSSTTDLTAIALLFPPGGEIGEWRCLFRAFCPADNLAERVKRDHVPYDEWVRKGWLIATEGSAVDYEAVQQEIEALARQYRVRYIGVDEWNSSMLVQALEKKGLLPVIVKQTISGTSPAIKHIEKLLLDRQITHDANPIARWCFGNAVVAVDGNENKKLMKNRSFERIDLIMALVDAMAVAVNLELKPPTIYEQRGIRAV
ncbi:MAG TPA: terminase large subunit [Candidatus Hydrogenedentes bacterium]|nr:terminase large subunit [Candidatus Hydrogenedentota bacterium]